MGGKRLADFFIGGEDGGVVADKIMQAGTQTPGLPTPGIGAL